MGKGESPAHAPRFPYRLGTHGTVWGFGLVQHNDHGLLFTFHYLTLTSTPASSLRSPCWFSGHRAGSQVSVRVLWSAHRFSCQRAGSTVSMPVLQSACGFSGQRACSLVGAPVLRSACWFIGRCTGPPVSVPVHQSLYPSIFCGKGIKKIEWGREGAGVKHIQHCCSLFLF